MTRWPLLLWLPVGGCVCMTAAELRGLKASKAEAEATGDTEAHDAEVEALAETADANADAALAGAEMAAPFLPPGVGPLALAGFSLLCDPIREARRRKRA